MVAWPLCLPMLLFFINPVWFGGPASLLSVFQLYTIVFFELRLRIVCTGHTYPGCECGQVCEAGLFTHNM